MKIKVGVHFVLSEFLQKKKKNDKMSVDRLTAAEQILQGNNNSLS